MGRSSSSSNSSGGGSSRPRVKISDAPIYTDAIIRRNKKARTEVRIQNTTQDITKKQIANPNRMKGGDDSRRVWDAVASKAGNFVTDKFGNAIRTKKGSIVMTSKGKKEYEAEMSRIPLSQAQVKSQRKFVNIMSIPLMFVPGGGLISSAMRHNLKQTHYEGGQKVFTYKKGSELTQEEMNEIATETAKAQGKDVEGTIDLTKRKKKTIFTKIFGGKEKFGASQSLTGGTY
tara:strand:- start:10664 stop:11356 length:693 start_codon:yes stop_codon:yes gene_type:complete